MSALLCHFLDEEDSCTGLGITALLAGCANRGYDGAVRIRAGGPVVNGCGVTISGDTIYYLDVNELLTDPPTEESWVLFATSPTYPYSHGPGSYSEDDLVMDYTIIPVNYFLYRVREVRTQVGYATIYRTTVPDYICGTS